VSDQRFGVRCEAIPSVIITHQVFPFTPMAQSALRAFNRRRIERFDRCWIMDEPEAPGLAGELSHGKGLPVSARYIGTLSRMTSTQSSKQRGAAHLAPKRSVMAVISGPEPQRTLFEEKVIAQLRNLPGEHLVVQGLPSKPMDRTEGNITIRSHMNADELGEAMRNAELIVSRSGYTTLMDLAALGRSGLIVPTPGQSEQEYLARLHGDTGRFIVHTQDALDIAKALAAQQRSHPARTNNAGLLERALEDLAALTH
ncbi:MAG TPA: glycosyltransferase, partial [Flavobacteriales bacterium]|nr:glycosyltransferase [Flavobacteriales bacterium]